MGAQAASLCSRMGSSCSSCRISDSTSAMLRAKSFFQEASVRLIASTLSLARFFTIKNSGSVA